jgi:hypothetical protein
VKRTTIIVPLCLCLALGMSGCSITASSSSTGLATDDSTNAAGNTDGAYKQAASLAADNAEYEATVLSDGEIDQVYTFTLEGVQYSLPCDASQFTAAGWNSDTSLIVEAGTYSSASSPMTICLGSDTDKVIELQFVNQTGADANWTECTVVGITVSSSDVSPNMVNFATSKGIELGDSFAEVQEAYGATSEAIDRFGTLGYNFTIRNDASMAGYRWYGQAIDSLSFISTSTTLYDDWSADNYVRVIRMESFRGIDATE